MSKRLMFALASLTAALGVPVAAQQEPPPTTAQAQAILGEAKVICEADDGALWGRSLCGPMLLVRWQDRSAMANQKDAAGALAPGAGGLFVGVVPETHILANTPTEWSGVRWTQLLWPFPQDEAERRVLLAHEMFHRIQADLGLTRAERGNRHLDSLEGRYLLQLEWRALERALTGATAQERAAGVDDALAFRQARYERFPTALEDEAALQVNEGVPEYTGVRLGLADPAARTRYAVRNLHAFLAAPTFIRSFAYASGAAYGLLLDEADPQWKDKVRQGARIDALLMSASGWKADPARGVALRAARYDADGSLRRAEETREAARLQRVAAWKAKLVDGPVLSLPLGKANFQFNPQTLQALDDIGTVYPTIRVTDAWGSLEVEGGALVARDPRRVVVPATGLSPTKTQGDGWKLTLAPGWSIIAASRPADYTISGPPAP